MDFLPIFLNIRNKKVIVDGGGTVAARRTERALQAGALVYLFDTDLCEDFTPLLTNKNLKHFPRAFESTDIDGAICVYGASEDPVRDKTLYQAAQKANILANVADVNEYCDFITPSVVDRSPLVVAISSGGTAPIIARILRARIESLLPPAYGRLAAFLNTFRAQVAEAISKPRSRRRFWESMIDGPVGDQYLAGNRQNAKELLISTIESEKKQDNLYNQGEVYLVGAGPGDPDLLTFRALRLMQRCDVVLYDRLVHTDILDLIRRDAERIYVGKKAKQHTMSQENITALMIELAAKGKRVLRLKGGDPFIFGRGGEEIETLAKHDIPFQVVPGITAAAGASSYAGIPLTHRDYAQSCVFVTAHGKDGILDLDWDMLVRPNQTVAIYMGLGSLDQLVEGFKKRNVPNDKPVAIIENATQPEQKVVIGDINNIDAKAKNAKLIGPAIILIGDVIKLRNQLEWFKSCDNTRFSMSLTPQEKL